MDVLYLKKEFLKRFGESDKNIHIYFAPGRVNLIGEHTDYNGGYVFPCALSYGTYLLARQSDDQHIHLKTTNFDFSLHVSIDEINRKYDNEWVNYPLGVMNQFVNRGYGIKGTQMLFSGNIPNGAGLSSSASVEVVTAFALNDIQNTHIGIMELIKLSQKAENEFVGVNCGIMDQFAVAMGKKDHAIFLNCDTLDYQLVPLILNDYCLVISNTNKRRCLADSKYNERRSECDKAVEYLKTAKNIDLLGELTTEEFEKYQLLITDPVIRKRAKHVVYEIDRTKKAVEALSDNNLIEFGKLMNASHDSLRDDYEVTGFELDTLVEESRKIEGVAGSRMTGAGFGGCTVSLVHINKVTEFCLKVGEKYTLKTGLTADFYIADVADGVKRLV